MNAPAQPPVPSRYRGVWRRTLLETPQGRDDTTWVHWLQTAHHHADLRVPLAARQPAAPGLPAGSALALQQGFAGRTEVRRLPEGEQCWWLRELDFQPPSTTPDAGWMRFDGADRVIETGVHGEYLEIWERLPDSTGPVMALERDHGRERLLRAGDWLAHVQARTAAWPAALQPGATLQHALLAEPHREAALLDMGIAFGRWVEGMWHIERSTRPGEEGRRVRVEAEAAEDGWAEVTMAGAWGRWQAVE